MREYTVEAGRPDTVTQERLEALKRMGVTRISINPQTFNDEVLQEIGRSHTAQCAQELFCLRGRTAFPISIWTSSPGFQRIRPQAFAKRLTERFPSIRRA